MEQKSVSGCRGRSRFLVDHNNTALNKEQRIYCILNLPEDKPKPLKYNEVTQSYNSPPYFRRRIMSIKVDTSNTNSPTNN